MGYPPKKPEVYELGWAKIKQNQARDAESLAAVASGIGEYGISNACYRLAGILKDQSKLEAEREKIRAGLTTSKPHDTVETERPTDHREA